MFGGLPFHAVGEKYIDAVRDIVGALPLLIPVTGTPLNIEELLGILDGVFLPGSGSNVAPSTMPGRPAMPCSMKPGTTQPCR